MDITHDNVCSSMLSCFYSHLLSTGRPISSFISVSRCGEFQTCGEFYISYYSKMFEFSPFLSPQHSLIFIQESLAQQRIRREVSRFEEEEGLFEGIQKRLLERFQSVFLSVDSELASIENALNNEDDLSSLLQVFTQGR